MQPFTRARRERERGRGESSKNLRMRRRDWLCPSIRGTLAGRQLPPPSPAPGAAFLLLSLPRFLILLRWAGERAVTARARLWVGTPPAPGAGCGGKGSAALPTRDFQPSAAAWGRTPASHGRQRHSRPAWGCAARLRQSPQNNSVTSVCDNALYAHHTGTERVYFP